MLHNSKVSFQLCTSSCPTVIKRLLFLQYKHGFGEAWSPVNWAEEFAWFLIPLKFSFSEHYIQDASLQSYKL